LSDLMTIIEYKGNVEGLKFVWIGDGNNVCNSAILMCAIMGMAIVVACPKGYEPDEDIVQQAIDMGGDVTITDDVQAVAKGADVLYTDVWVSMGDEDERDKRLNDLAPYQINAELVAQAKNDCIVLHCLPAHRGEEITEDVMKGVHSAILDQAENRLHAQKALIVSLLTEK
ncbi:MAG: ornithine carbamoyltransferase, partial [Methanosarcinales archaeon]|nr:ornithine carbamoyltransferase [Methanosarcinales archaeon]